MKKTIKGLLLAMAVFAGSAYSYDVDSAQMDTYMKNKMKFGEDVMERAMNTLAVVKAVDERKRVFIESKKKLEDLGVDLTPVNKETNKAKQVETLIKTMDDIISRGQEKIKGS